MMNLWRKPVFAAGSLLVLSAGCATQEDGQAPAQKSNTAGEVAQGLQATVIDVDPTNVQGAVARTLFGVNHRYVNNARGTWNPSTQDCAPAFNTAVDYMSPSVMRYPGGLIANLFDWRRAIGASRKNQVVYPFYAPNVSTQPCNFGIHEAMTWAAAHGMRTSYVFGVANATAQDAADLVEYLNAPNDGSNRGGGVDYAARRAANGHPAPFNVHLFELGNEPNVDPSIVDERYWMAAERSLTACPGHEPCYARQYALGDTVEFTSRQPVVADDDWSDATSYSNGAAGQKKYTRYRPVVSDTQHVFVGGVEWTEVANFNASTSTSTHYVFDDATGAISFGNGVQGKIPAYLGQITVTYRTTRPGFKDYYAAMKAVDPSIEIYSSYADSKFITEMGSSLPYDGLVLHQYPFSSETIDDRRHNDLMLQVGLQSLSLALLRESMRSTVGGTRGPTTNVAVTEFSLFPAPNGTTPADYLRSLDSAMYTTLQLMDYMSLGVTDAHRHVLVDDLAGLNGRPDHALVNGPYYVLSASALAYRLYRQMVADTLVTTSIAGNPERTIWDGRTVPYLRAVATKDAQNNVYVLVVNRDQANGCTATIRLGGGYAMSGTATRWQISGASYKSFNDIYHPNDVTLQTSTTPVSGTQLDVTFPAHSITAIAVHR